MSERSAEEPNVAKTVTSIEGKPPADDADFEPINFHEAFCRAKRNSLFWSSLAILATIGSAVDDDGNSVSLFQVGLEYEQWKIVLVCYVAAIFMLAGYYRAERLLPLLNSNAFRQRKMVQYGRVVAALSDQAADAEQSFSTAVAELSRATMQIRRLAEAASKKRADIETAMERANNAASPSTFFATENAQNPATETLRNRLAEIQLSLTTVDKRLQAVVSPQEDGRSFSDRPQMMASQVASIEQKLTRPLEELRNSAMLFTAYDQAIGRGEKSWFWLHDRLPVYLAFALATGLTIWRLPL